MTSGHGTIFNKKIVKMALRNCAAYLKLLSPGGWV
jgi:hypothetical protein